MALEYRLKTAPVTNSQFKYLRDNGYNIASLIRRLVEEHAVSEGRGKRESLLPTTPQAKRSI